MEFLFVYCCLSCITSLIWSNHVLVLKQNKQKSDIVRLSPYLFVFGYHLPVMDYSSCHSCNGVIQDSV